MTLTVFQNVSWTALLSETPRYFGPWYRDTPDWGSYWVWSRPMWDAITSPPIDWSHTRSDPCWPYITVQKLHCRVAYYCVQWPLLCCNVWAEPLYFRPVRNTVLLLGRGIGTPRLRDRTWCGLGRWGTPLGRPTSAGPTPRMIPVNPISLCKNFIIMLHTIVVIFNDLYCISICNLNRFIVYLSETPRYFGPWYKDTPT